MSIRCHLAYVDPNMRAFDGCRFEEIATERFS
jgi:hypothetical protein